ncbi:MAG: DUF1549 and DUF1553 domain-containing protein [Gemmataceae bacterium]
MHNKLRGIVAICVFATLFGSWTTSQTHAESDSTDGPRTNARLIDFDNDIMPVFTKAGCNAGACHGAAIGRGGLRLSLYGGNPEADYEAIVRELEGRRVNLAHPEKSLIVLKPTRKLKHGGGRLLFSDDEGTKLLLKWIKQGAKHTTSEKLARVEVSPRKHVAEDLKSPLQLKATAHFTDGTKRDVTRWTVFTPEDESAVEVDPESGESRIRRNGRHIVNARYLDQVVPIEIIVPLSDKKVDLADEPRRNFIDSEILQLLEVLRVPPSPMADDATFLRRLTLDLTGRLPSAKKVKAFLTDKNPKKRAALVDELLSSKEFTEYWTFQLAKLLRVQSKQGDQQGARTYHRWLANQLEKKVGYDELTRAIILASGDTHKVGPANFYRTVDGARAQAELMTEVFMGSRLRCANCHNHPLDRWTQDDYHGLAAIFAKVESGRVVKINRSGEVVHPRTLAPATARIPGEYFLDSAVKDGRKALAEWLTKRENPYFAKAIVNRLWKRMMGRGLVESTDDFRATNPATHPRLLGKLAEDFAKNGYKLRHTLRLIANSATYARSANATKLNKDDDRFYSHTLRQPLEPEVLADAISDVLGIADKYGNYTLGTRAVTLIDPKTRSNALDILGRCSREQSCESAAGGTDGLRKYLHLFNGELLNRRIGMEKGRLNQLIKGGKSPMEIVNEFYLVALNRHPRENERTFWNKQFDAKTPVNQQREKLEDFVWSLLTCSEFKTNH